LGNGDQIRRDSKVAPGAGRFREKMLNLQMIVVAAPITARTVRHWIYQLGGLGFIPLGILDNSVIPLPGSMDVLTPFLVV
jgi:hypothetical protein